MARGNRDAVASSLADRLARFGKSPPDLAESVRQLVAQIPAGRVATYGQVARYLGVVEASRWVGQWAVDHDHGPDCVCYRLVRSDGVPGKWIGGTSDSKVERLTVERVAWCTGRGPQRVDLEQVQWDQFCGPRPLAELTRWQSEVAGQLSWEAPDGTVDVVAAVDVAYPAPGVAQAAYVELDLATLQPIRRVQVKAPVSFPYITGLLAFRELPVYTRLLREVDFDERRPDVLMVDGSGVLHPRRAGIACMLGLLLDLPTIGVTKKLLCGEHDEPSTVAGRPMRQQKRRVPVSCDGTELGWAVWPPTTSQRPVFFSPGHRASVEWIAELLPRCWGKRRLPEPIYWADRLSRQPR
ncbi:MAG: endonuclease V [Pirellulales bacterium]